MRLTVCGVVAAGVGRGDVHRVDQGDDESEGGGEEDSQPEQAGEAAAVMVTMVCHLVRCRKRQRLNADQSIEPYLKEPVRAQKGGNQNADLPCVFSQPILATQYI